MPLGAAHNTFGGNPLDRASERRSDAAWLDARLWDPATVSVALWNGAPLVAGDPPRLARLPIDRSQVDHERLLFLGLDGETAVFAVDLEGETAPAAPGAFAELRRLAPVLAPAEAGIAATAKSVFDWRRRHRFCSNCGHATQAVDGGWKRLCSACEAEHFPRTDPVVIMLALNGDRCLLGRHGSWSSRRFSALAGFMEPGETIEEACARELKEEAGLSALSVAYHSSQPWPWPSQLMIGLFAEVADGEAVPDGVELEELRWFTRAEAHDLLEGRHPTAIAPPSLAIAHQLLRSWAG